MTRQNDFEGEMGRRYQEAMEVICPWGEEMEKREIEKIYDYIRGRHEEVSFLDLGCGGGEFEQKLTDHLRIYGGSINLLTCVDKSKVMIEKARVNLHWQSIHPFEARVVQSDIKKYLEAMRLVGPTSDIIISNFVLHNFSQGEREEVFPLIYEALTPRGSFYMLDKIAHTNPQGHSREYAAQLERTKTLAKRGMPNLVQPWLNHYEVDNAPERRMIEGELVDQLKAIGFREVNVLQREKMEATIEARK
jgi:SAM-dependent methyltransferase